MIWLQQLLKYIFNFVTLISKMFLNTFLFGFSSQSYHIVVSKVTERDIKWTLYTLSHERDESLYYKLRYSLFKFLLLVSYQRD